MRRKRHGIHGARKENGKKKKNVIGFICMIVGILLIAYFFIFAEKVIKPTLDGVAEVKVQARFSEIINDVSGNIFSENESDTDVLCIDYDANGNVATVRLDTALLNKLATEITTSIQENISKTGTSEIKMSFGSLMGSQLLSQVGPYIKFKIVPIGMTKVGYKTEFESNGINQTKYKVYLELNTQARVLVPFTDRKISITNDILVAETVIVGEVPDNYINIPKEGILDTIN